MRAPYVAGEARVCLVQGLSHAAHNACSSVLLASSSCQGRQGCACKFDYALAGRCFKRLCLPCMDSLHRFVFALSLWRPATLFCWVAMS